MTEYNVVCIEHDHVSTVSGGPLWWRAKKRSDEGYLDALPISGVECGCQRPTRRPNAPYRVFGFTDEGREYDTPFDTFVAAVKAFRDRWGYGETVFIQGVSSAVENQLKYG